MTREWETSMHSINKSTLIYTSISTHDGNQGHVTMTDPQYVAEHLIIMTSTDMMNKSRGRMTDKGIKARWGGQANSIKGLL